MPLCEKRGPDPKSTVKFDCQNANLYIFKGSLKREKPPKNLKNGYFWPKKGSYFIVEYSSY